jgi:hemerythrin HHE cation binding domain-containing protein
MTLPGLDELATNTQKALNAVDPTEFLLAEHAWLRSVMSTYRTVIRDGECASLVADVEDLSAALELHIRREEEAYFPAVEDVMAELGQGSTFDMYGEHDAIRIRMGELLKTLAEGMPSAGSAFGAFSRSLLIHFENEEELIFAEVPEHLSDETRQDILQEFARLAETDATSN